MLVVMNLQRICSVLILSFGSLFNCPTVISLFCLHSHWKPPETDSRLNSREVLLPYFRIHCPPCYKIISFFNTTHKGEKNCFLLSLLLWRVKVKVPVKSRLIGQTGLIIIFLRPFVHQLTFT